MRCSKELLRDLVVDPMARPASRWSDEVVAKYARVLGLHGPERIASTTCSGATQTIEDRVQAVVQALQRLLPSVECLAYVGVKLRASMLFIARQPPRLREIEACLDRARLGGSLERFLPNRRFSDAC